MGTHSDPSWIAPDNTNFVQIATDQLVGPDVGWYEWDVTAWYNARLGETTTVALRGAATSGYDFPLFEDREGTAFTAGAGGSLNQHRPAIGYFPGAASVHQRNREQRKHHYERELWPTWSQLCAAECDKCYPPSRQLDPAVDQSVQCAGTVQYNHPIVAGPSQYFYRLLVP